MIGVFEITEPDKQRTVFKSYYMRYEGNVRTKHWCPGVHKTRGAAEKQAKKVLKELRQK